MKKIQVYLTTYNRPHLVEKAIDSILNQSFNSYELIISDNSTNDYTKTIVEKKYFDKVRYIHRIPTDPDHFNTILKDVDSEYFMIFHDDDVMHSSMLDTLYRKIIARREVIAIGSNARVVKNGKLKRSLFCEHLKKDIEIENRNQMVQAYFKTGIVPLPSYLYRVEVAHKLRFNFSHGGKHCDAAFIIDLLNLGPVIFCACPLMDFYIHSGQDSFNNAFRDRIKLVNYITNTTSYNRRDKIFKEFRMRNLYAELKKELLSERTILSKKYCTIIKLIFEVSPFEYFPKMMLIRIYAYLFKKKTR